MGKLLQKLKGGKKSRHKNDVEELEWIDFDEDEEYEDDEYAGEEEYEDDEYAGDEEEYEYAEDEEEYEGDEYAEDEEEYEDGEYAEDEEEYEDDEYAEDEEEYEEYEYAEDEEEYEDDEYAEDEEEYEDDEYYEDEEEYEYDEYAGEEEYEDDEYYEDEEEYEDDEYAEDEEEYEYAEDEEEYEDDEYYEDDYYEDYDEDDEDAPESGIKRVFYKITNLSTVDYVVALTGVAVLVLAIVTGTLYMGARSNKAQIEAFAEVGEGMESISIIGQSGLLAIADAQASRMAAADIEEEDGEGGESDEEDTNGKKEVLLNLTSIQKDLKIKFVEKKSGKLVSGIAFEVEIQKPSGDTYSKKDEDKDGIIYEKDIAPGKYKVKITSPASDDEYGISGETIAITVRDAIEYKKVDVSDEVKTESQVNAAAEDTKVNQTVVESANKDTVEWVESTKTIIEGTEQTEDSYEKIGKDKIADPEKKAAAEFRLLAGINARTPDEDNPDGTDTEDGTGDGNDNNGNNGEDSTPEPVPVKTPEPEQPEKPDPTSDPDPTEKPDPTPDPTQAPVPTEKPSAPPTSAPTATPTSAATASPTAKPSATPSAKPGVTPTAAPSATPSATPNSAKTDTKTTLKSTDGEILYVKEADGKFREAKYADYYDKTKEFYRKVSKTTGKYKYTGWQTLEDGKTYFFDKNGNPVTGEQVIQGAKYSFNSDGSLNTGSGHLGIDVSKWNGSIDWNAVKNSGVSFVIIRCGYRGSSTGALIEDPMFRSNIQGATKAGLKVGVYFFTQAVNEVEAVEEASMAVGLIKGYNISYPVFLDVESSNGGRGDGINAATRTAVCRAFCQTVQNSGYKAGIYANKTWFTTHIDTPSLTGYKIWLAQYAAAPSYNRTKYDMWQYSSKGRISGISTDVDMNISYMGY